MAAELSPDPGLTVVAGPNGTGKTNLLEAIHTTIAGRSHRAVVDAELVRHGAPFARVRMELAGGTAGRRLDDRAGGPRPRADARHPQAPHRQWRGAPQHDPVGRGPRGPLPAGGDAAARRLTVGAPPIPGRHRGAARPARGPRPGRGGAHRHPAQRAPARDPCRGGVDRHPRLLGRTARAARRPGHARAARGAGRAGRADRPIARRGRGRTRAQQRSG